MAGDITQSTLNLTSDEKRTYGQLFQQADTEKLGVVTGDVAVKFFERTKLDPPILAEIWQIADTENRGLLTPAGFSVALRLIGHCQSGREPTLELAKQPGPLPRFDDAAGLPGQSSSIAPPSSPPPLAPQNSGPIRVPPLAPDKVNEYSSLFEKAGARNGFLAGDAAKQVFERARLPNETLGRIWNLSDTQQRGALNSTEFVIAMHLIASMKTGALRGVPQTLPAGLFEAAGRRGPPPPVPASRQFSSPGPQRTQSPTAGSPMAPQSMSPQTTGDTWVVTPQDKAKFDQIFSSIDKTRTGYINGDQAVQFFSNSGLSEETLASIWDLADINSEGQLSRDEFAVAMYLIRQQRAKREDRGNLPSTLPPNLIPPSMRQRTMPPSQPTAPAFDNAAFAPQQPKSAADDLFGLDAMSASDTASQQAPGSPVSPQRTGTYQPPPPPASNTAFKPFQPISSFGQGLASQNTGSSGQGGPTQTRDFQQSQSSTGGDDLLGDNDPDVSNKISDETMELGNMSNQIGQLRTQMQETQAKKSGTEAEITATMNQKRDLETRLAQFRTSYEQEIREVKALEERLNASRAETRKLQQELAMVEGAYQDLQGQHQQVTTALEADQRENASLKERLQQVNNEVSQLRPQLDKMRSDARQQKGMVAINKKQLSTSEAERDKMQSEMNELQSPVEQERSVTSPEPQIAEGTVVSPTPSTTSQSTNPFFRSASGGTAMSPSTFDQTSSSSQDQSAFDSFFQQSSTPDTSAGPAPVTTFRSATPTSHPSTPPASTPSASTTDASPATEPPAPPESRQITSSSLPLRPSGLRTESVSSSVRANPPASRAGESTSATPTQIAGTPAGSIDGDDKPEQTPSVLTTDAYGDAVDFAKPPSDQAGSSNQNQLVDKDLKPEEAVDAVPGAFPDSVTPGTPQPPSILGAQESETDRGIGSTSGDTKEAPGTLDTFSSAGTTSNAPEFPPLQEIEQDSDSSSESDSRFDDDFNSASKDAVPEASLQQQTVETSATEPVKPPTSLSLPPRNGAENDTSELPTPTAQMSPPTYEQSIPLNAEPRGSNQFPPEFQGLLPSREMSDSPPKDVPQSPPDALTNTVSERTITNGHVPQSASTADDDFESAFGDLSESKDADDATGQDSFAFDSTQNDTHEFNPTFESPAPPSAVPASTAQARSPTTVTNISMTSQSASDSFANFQPSFDSSTSPFDSTSSARQTSTAETSSNDWDEIFAGLDSNPESTSQGDDPFTIQGNSSDPSKLNPPTGAPQLPTLTKSITNEHDDPILKTLTGMGYDREEAVKALEKYDYNLDMAADYLTSRH